MKKTAVVEKVAVVPMPEPDEAEIVRTVFAEQFGPAVLLDLLVTPGFDHDGDPVLRIMAVVEDAPALAPKTMGGFIRHLRSRLGADTFPIVSYVSRSDLLEAAS